MTQPDWNSNVQPRRRVLPRPTKQWSCHCLDRIDRKWSKRRTNPAYLARCPDCGERRPEEGEA